MKKVFLWKTTRVAGNDTHITPENEQHILDRQCGCNPRFETKGGAVSWVSEPRPIIVIHKSWSAQ